MIIVTDSAADLPSEEIESLGIQVAPLVIEFPEGSVQSCDITPDEFYARLKAMWPRIPSTSQPSAGMFAALYKQLCQFKEDILSVHISSGLSGTIESARLGAKDVPEANISFVDTLTLSGGERFQVLAAAQAARKGWSKQQILDRLKDIREHTEVIYTLETLTYLAKGGRIGRVQALAGSLLGIKPLIAVDRKDGKYNTVGKERTVPKALNAISDHLSKAYGNTALRVTILHGQFADQAKALSDVLSQKLMIKKLEVQRISPVLGVHTGPGVVGAAVVPAHLMEGLE